MVKPVHVGKLCLKSPLCRQYFIVGPCRMYPKVQVNLIDHCKKISAGVCLWTVVEHL